MNWIAPLLAAVPPATPDADGLGVIGNLFAASCLLVFALGLIALEFVLISGGAIGITAVLCAIGAIWFAFAAGPLAGWVFTLLVPICGGIAIRMCLKLMMTSNMVVQSEISGHAGYGHAASDHGVTVGASGELVTDAYPTGRARFLTASGNMYLDVTVGGAVLGKGAAVQILKIEGPVILVGPLSSSHPTST